MSDVETFYCLIVGSRSFSDYGLLAAKCDLLLRNWGSVVIVSGGARGADALAKRYAMDRGYRYKEFPADWDTYGRRAGYIRNRAMHEYISTHANRRAYRLIVTFKVWGEEFPSMILNFLSDSTRVLCYTIIMLST